MVRSFPTFFTFIEFVTWASFWMSAEEVLLVKVFSFLLLCWVGVYWSIYKSSYNVSNISYLNSPPQMFSFIPLPLIPGKASTGIIFAFNLCHLPSPQAIPPHLQAEPIPPSCSLTL
jgi:hypothetical protein